jgi:hypothetical protein
MSEKIEEIKDRILKHDFYFQYSDDHSQWRKGNADLTGIISLLKEVPAKDIGPLLELVPEDVRPSWIKLLSTCKK